MLVLNPYLGFSKQAARGASRAGDGPGLAPEGWLYGWVSSPHGGHFTNGQTATGDPRVIAMLPHSSPSIPHRNQYYL